MESNVTISKQQIGKNMEGTGSWHNLTIFVLGPK